MCQLLQPPAESRLTILYPKMCLRMGGGYDRIPSMGQRVWNMAREMRKPIQPRALRTRSLKAECGACGSIIYASRKVYERCGRMPWPCLACSEREMRSTQYRDVCDERNEYLDATTGDRTIGQKWIAATRKPHTCGSCGGEIPTGETCRLTTFTIAGQLDELRECFSCADPHSRGIGTVHHAALNIGEWRAEY